MKTISLDEKAYALLRELKLGGKGSFSDVIKRHFEKPTQIRSSAGSWSDVSDKRVAKLRRETLASFEGASSRR